MIDLTPIANALISLLALLITTFLIPWIKAKVKAEKLAEVQNWTRICVSAAEQIFKQSGMGRQKAQYVREYLLGKGYNLNVNEINALIESAVHDLNLDMAEYSDSGDLDDSG